MHSKMAYHTIFQNCFRPEMALQWPFLDFLDFFENTLRRKQNTPTEAHYIHNEAPPTKIMLQIRSNSFVRIDAKFAIFALSLRYVTCLVA